MGQVAYPIIGEARVAAALSTPRGRDQLEADALNKYETSWCSFFIDFTT
jgi:hypothetical protein